MEASELGSCMPLTRKCHARSFWSRLTAYESFDWGLELQALYCCQRVHSVIVMGRKIGESPLCLPMGLRPAKVALTVNFILNFIFFTFHVLLKDSVQDLLTSLVHSLESSD